MTGHLDADGLAEFRAGLVAGRRRRSIAAHLSSCPQCTELDGRLAALSGLLAAAPLPPVPDALARRLDGVLAAEKLIPAERAVVPARSRRHWSRGLSSQRLSLRVLVPAAAVVAVAAAGYGLTQLGSSPSTFSSASSGSMASGVHREAGRATSFGAAMAGPAGPAAENGKRLPAMDSDTDYEPATLARQLSVALDASAGRQLVAVPAAVADCVSKVADGRKPVLVQRARYQGAPVTVVIVPAQSRGYQALLAGPMCSATDSDIVAEAVLSPGISAP
jgi:hypothetical protein